MDINSHLKHVHILKQIDPTYPEDFFKSYPIECMFQFNQLQYTRKIHDIISNVSDFIKHQGQLVIRLTRPNEKQS